MKKIKLQCRDNKGNLIAQTTPDDVKNIQKALQIKEKWEKKYTTDAYMISIHFINK